MTQDREHTQSTQREHRETTVLVKLDRKLKVVIMDRKWEHLVVTKDI